jgi:hypothetical protein
MPDVGPYGYTQNATDQGVTANQMVGERAGSTTGTAMLPSSSPAFLSTAPYIDRRSPKRIRKCKGKDDTCEAFPKKGTEWCAFHQPDDA